MQRIVTGNPLLQTNGTHPRRNTPHPRSGTLYIAVMGTAIIVSVVAFSALALARLHPRDAQESNDWYEARLAALSGVENAVTRINANENWRTDFQNNVEYPATPVEMGSGTFTWKLVDDDGDLADDDSDPVTIYGIGRVGASTSVETVTGQSSSGSGSGSGPSDPQELRSFTSTSSTSDDKVLSDKWWAQYFKPNLPAEATSWQVTSVEIRCKQEGSASSTTNVRLYLPQSNNMPSSTIIDETAVAERSLPSSFNWHEVPFSGHSGLDPNTGLCLALTTNSSNDSMSFQYQGGSVSEPDSGFIDGDPNWKDIKTDKAMLYKVHGTYETASSSSSEPGVYLLEGSWSQSPAP